MSSHQDYGEQGRRGRGNSCPPPRGKIKKQIATDLKDSWCSMTSVICSTWKGSISGSGEREGGAATSAPPQELTSGDHRTTVHVDEGMTCSSSEVKRKELEENDTGGGGRAAVTVVGENPDDAAEENSGNGQCPLVGQFQIGRACKPTAVLFSFSLSCILRKKLL
ncbi:hypothetical protein GW17_00046977 [Ensete ventricosum]|nr:hypothetical protein GW17_00046977 [Ensete ventricosum]